MSKRRTAGIQRRQRASQEALARRVERRAGGTFDWRIAAIIGFLLLGVVAVIVAIFVASAPCTWCGQTFANMGGQHVQDGTEVRAQDPNAYNSLPATSGAHWGSTATSPSNWGVFTIPVPESQAVHNLEHGGIIIWYEPDQLETADVEELADYVRGRVTSGVSGRFKFILSPWNGADFGHAIAVTAWTHLLYLDSVNLDAINGFADAHYGRSPEPNGGPAPPANPG